MVRIRRTSCHLVEPSPSLIETAQIWSERVRTWPKCTLIRSKRAPIRSKQAQVGRTEPTVDEQHTQQVGAGSTVVGVGHARAQICTSRVQNQSKSDPTLFEATLRGLNLARFSRTDSPLVDPQTLMEIALRFGRLVSMSEMFGDVFACLRRCCETQGFRVRHSFPPHWGAKTTDGNFRSNKSGCRVCRPRR